ncbi:MAG: glycogen/starch synthase, partial [Gemmatimonadetes bacterium]|nr:glycogen/starch synthase [Gemmatimonadota bacterium]
MRIVHISPEAVPYAKTGGLADVVGALSAYLSRSGHAVTLFLPLYRMIREAGFEPGPVELELGPAELGLPVEAAIRSVPSTGGPSVRVVDAPGLFDRDGLYGIEGSDHPDNLLRFAVFCRAALCAIEESPDILHVHDWQSSLAAVLLRSGPPPGATAILERLPASVLTLHNLAYQGRFAEESWPDTGLPGEWYRPDRLEYYGGINLLKGGLLTADR